MSSGQNCPPLPSPGATDRRRASITGQGFHDFFGRAGSMSMGGPAMTPGPYPGPITTAALNAQRRRLSLTTVGLSGSPNQTSPFNLTAARPRNDSLSSANSGSVDESPFEDEPGPSVSASGNPTTPFGRRLSFSARAMQNVRTPGALGNNNGRSSVLASPSVSMGRGSLQQSSSSFPSPGQPPLMSSSAAGGRRASAFAIRPSPLSTALPSPTTTSPPAVDGESATSSSSYPHSPNSIFPSVLERHFALHPHSNLDRDELTQLLFRTGEGFNFAENLRTRAERASISGAHPMYSMQHAQQQQREQHQRARSVTVMEPPAKEMPKNPRVPDAFQERILKGDFYMD